MWTIEVYLIFADSDLSKRPLMKLKHLIATLVLALGYLQTDAQRLRDNNNIFWAGSFNTIGLSKHTSLWLEYQWRREDGLKNWQQSLSRGGIQFHFNNDITAMAGYGYIILYPYGDYPIGKYSMPEHRIFEQVIWNDYKGRVNFSHRLRLEQRYLGKIDQTADEYAVTGWTYLNRVRYQLRITVPLNHPKLQTRTWYLACLDELAIGFGKNVNQNVFDQNRFGVVAGYQFNKLFRLEGGFMSQILQQPALVGGKQVYQYNRGGTLSLYFTRR
jgi:hypothetical protein